MNKRVQTLISCLSLFCLTLLVGGCNEYVLLNPKGPIDEDERFLLVVSFSLMLLVVIPVIVMSIWIPIKYRAGNANARYTPHWSTSRTIEFFVWLVPAIIVLINSVFIWRYTFKLDPYKPIVADLPPVNIEVLSLDWKWLFIYPDQNIAVVNKIAFPVKAPLSFRITSATVMTSFFIPQLGSQIYAMAGMQTRLNLLADEKGTYTGQNQQFSGVGYSDMFFKAEATSPADFDAWVQKIKMSPDTLTRERYNELARPSIADSVIFFSAVEPGLFDSVICTFDPNMQHMLGGQHMKHGSGSMHSNHCAPEGH